MRTWVCLSLLLAVAAAVPHTVRIGHRPSTKQRYLAEGKLPEYLRRKEARLATASKLITANQPIMDFDDMAYFGFIDLGTPRQTFMVFLDSGSSTLWVPDTQCGGGGTPTCGIYCSQTSYQACLNFCRPECCKGGDLEKLASSDPCLSKRRFNSTASTTYVSVGTSFDLTYQTGEVKGILGKDTFCMTNTSLCVPNQVFGQATSLGSDFGTQPMDGILGLGWPALAFNNINPPFFNAWTYGKMDKGLYTVFLTNVGSQVSQGGGQLTVGDYDNTHCSQNVDWITLTSQTFWQFKLSGVSAGSFSQTPGSGWQAISDTASTFIGAPQAAIDGLAQVVGATYNSQYQSYFIDCDAATPNIVFTINGKPYSVSPKNYILAVGPGMCQFAFFPMSGGGFYPAWMLGPPLIREYCQVHNIELGQIGFAKVLA